MVDHHRFKTGERATLDPFDAVAGDVPARKQRDLMEGPFFSLAKTKRVQPLLYRSGATEVQVYALPDHGMTTIWDADVLIWAASQILAAMGRGIPTSRFFRLTPYRLLTAVGRATGKREYVLLKRALSPLHSTGIRTTIRHGEHWRRQQFSWINEWEELVTRAGRCEGIEFVLPEWFYQGVLDAELVLAIYPAYFALTGGIEPWPYRVARKHAGRRPHGWRFELRHLHAKSASLARYSDFALDIRRVVRRRPLLGYALAIEWMTHSSIGILGASHIGISGAPVSGLPAHRSRPSVCERSQTVRRRLRRVMILTRLSLPHADRNAVFARPLAYARTCRRSFLIPIACCQRSAPAWLGNGNQKQSPLRFLAAACERRRCDQQAEAVIRSRSPISIARPIRTVSSSCSSTPTAFAVGARLHRSICVSGESNESSRTLDRKCTSRDRFADVHATDRRVEPSATIKRPTFDGLYTFARTLNNPLTGVLSKRVGGPT